MEVIKNEVFPENEHNQQSHSDADVEIIPQDISNDAYPQNVGLSSISVDSQEIKGISELQHHYASDETFSYIAKDIL